MTKQPQHCDHEDFCRWYPSYCEERKQACPHGAGCTYDTRRSRPATEAEQVMIYDAEHPDGIPFPQYANAIRRGERERVIKRFFELEENGIPECKSRKCSANDDPYPCNKCIFDYILAESLRREGAP